MKTNHRHKQIANAVAKLASTCIQRPRASDISRISEFIIGQTKGKWRPYTVVEALKSLEGAEVFPRLEDIDRACRRVEVARDEQKGKHRGNDQSENQSENPGLSRQTEQIERREETEGGP